MGKWRPQLEEVNRELRLSGVAVSGGVKHVELRERTPHETRSCLFLTGYSDAFNTMNRTTVLAEVATCVPSLTPIVVKRYGERLASIHSDMESGDDGTIHCSTEVNQGDPMGPVMFFISLRLGLKRFSADFEGKGVEAFVYTDDITLGLMGVTAHTVRDIPLVRREFNGIGAVVNPVRERARIPLKGHAPDGGRYITTGKHRRPNRGSGRGSGGGRRYRKQ